MGRVEAGVTGSGIRSMFDRARTIYQPMLRPLRMAWLAALVCVIIWYLIGNWDLIADLTRDMGLAAVGAVVLLVVGAKVVYAEQARLAYHLAGGPTVGFGGFYRVYTISDMAKYIPGGVWGVAARVNSYLSFGVSGRDTARGFGFEKASLVLSTLFGGALCVSFGLDGGVVAVLDGVGTSSSWRAIEVGLIAVSWVGVTWVSGRVALGDDFRPFHVGRVVVEHSIVVVLLGLGVWVPANSVGADLNVFLAIGAFNVGRAAGLVAVFAPAGVGVREAVGIWVLRQQDLDDVALFAFGASRVLTTVAEAATFAAVGALVRSGRLELPDTD